MLVDPERFGGDADAGAGTAPDGIAAAVDRYVAMTRATRELVILVDE
ncbi:hypothetical protein [Agromyces sp. NPDC058104]